MLWNAAKTDSHPSGNGIAFSIDQEVPWSLVPFTRIGYSPQGIYRTSTEVDWGIVWIAPFGRLADRVGLGATWAKPTLAPQRDQFAMELLYRVELVEGMQISPDVQFIFDPALNSNSSYQTVFGLRIRAFI
jgi:porin